MWDDKKSNAWGGGLNKGYASRMLKLIEDEEEERIQKQQREEEKRVKQAKEGKAKTGDFLTDTYNAGGVGGFLAGAAGFVKDAAVDVYKTGESAVKGNVAVQKGNQAASALESATAQRDAINAERNEFMDTLKGKDWEKPEVKKKLAEYENQISSINKATEDDKKDIKESQKIDTKKTAADTAETFLNVATLGTGTAAKAAAKQGAKSIARATARGAAEGATFSGAAGLTDSISEGDNAEETARNVIASAGTGALLGGTVSGIGSTLGKKGANKAKTPVDEVVEEAVVDNTPQSGTQFSDITDDELNNQIELFRANKNRTNDVEADYARHAELLDERKFREDAAARTAFEANGLPNDVEGAESALTKLDSREELPDTMYKDATPVSSIDDVIAREDVPVEIKNAAQEVDADRKMILNQMDEIMSPDTKAASIARLDEQYELELRELNQRYGDPLNPGSATSDIRFQTAKNELDTSYQDSRAELDMLEAQDAPQYEELASMLDLVNSREQNIVLDTSALMREKPDMFRDIDEVEFDAQRKRLEQNLEEAKKYNDNNTVIDSVAETSNPTKSFERNKDAPQAYKENILEEVDAMPSASKKLFKHLSDFEANIARFTSPSQWLEKMGLRNEVVDLHTPILRGKELENMANKADSEALQAIKNVLTDNPQAVRQIWDYLEGKRATISAADEQSATLIRGLLDSKRAELESLGFKTLDDYMPHMFDKDSQILQSIYKGKVTGDITANNLKQRIANSDDYSRDTLDVLSTYLTSINRKIHLEPPLKALNDAKLELKMSQAEAGLVDAYITQLKGFNESKVGNGYNSMIDAALKKIGRTDNIGRDHYKRHLGAQRMMSAVATMGGNVGTALRNTTQVINTVADIGPDAAAVGVTDGIRMLTTEAGRAELRRAGIFDGGVSKNFYDSITQAGTKGKVAKGTEVATNGLMSMIQGTDVALRAQAYAGAKWLAKKQGLEGKAAEDFAIRKVVDTQFITSVVDMPVAFNGPGIRSLTQLATFSGKQAGFLKRVGLKTIPIRDKDGNYRLDKRSVVSVLTAGLTAAALTEVLKPAMGFSETEFIPFYSQIAPFVDEDASSSEALYRSPLVRLLAGDGKSKTGLIEAIQGVGKGDGADSLSKFWDDNWSSLIPAGTQIKKTTEGLETTQSGISMNKKGKVRFLQDMGLGNEMQAALFGQYSTEAGQNWIKEGFPTLTDKQTDKVLGQKTRESQEKFASFYTSMKNIPYEGGRQAAYDKVKEYVSSGNNNRAAREAAEWNVALDESLQSYYEQFGELPTELREFAESKRISVSKVADSLK